MTKVLSHFLRRFQALQVAVIGDAVLDTFVDGRPHKLCSEGPVPVVWKEAQSEAPGGAANVAANAAALGARTRLVGLIGPDPAGGRLRSHLERHGVDLSLLLESPSCTTHHKTRILAGGQYVVRVDEGDTAARARGLTAAVEAAQAHADVVIL